MKFVPLARNMMNPDGEWQLTNEDLKGRWMVYGKVSGIRCTADLPAPAYKGQVILYGEDGEELTGFEVLRGKLQEINDTRYTDETLIIYGILAPERDSLDIDFQTFECKNNTANGYNVKFHIFDAIDSKDGRKSSYLARYHASRRFVEEAFREFPGSINRFSYTRAFTVTDPTLEKMLDYNLDNAYGHCDGIFVRKEDEAPSLGFSSSFWYLNTFKEASAKVIGLTFNYDNTACGKFTCLTENGKEFQVLSRFSLEQHRRLTKIFNQGRLPNIKYRYQTLLTTKDGIPSSAIFTSFQKE